jgi:hypothetical protein
MDFEDIPAADDIDEMMMAPPPVPEEPEEVFGMDAMPEPESMQEDALT